MSTCSRPSARTGFCNSGDGQRTTSQASLLIRAAVVAALAGTPCAVLAQEAPASSQDPADIQEVMITGSRVIREGLSSPTPVTSLSADELLSTRPQALVEGLATLPALSSSVTPKSIQGSTRAGAGSFLNLRNLGPTRNLVLLNGRRVTPTNIDGNVDINMLPQSLVSNVSIVTGGASAAYGSDAVAGVSNFIVDTRFTGLKAEAGGGISDRHDGEYYKTSIAWGAPFLDDRLHVVASFDMRRSQKAYAENRGWANKHCAPIPIPGVTTANQSATNPRQTIACDVSQAHSAYGGSIVSGPLTSPTAGISFGEGGIPQDFVYGALKTTNFQVSGSGDPAYVADNVNFTTPLENKVGFGHVLYEITDNVEAFAQVTVGTSNANYDQTPPNFSGARPFTIFQDNAFLPESIRQRMQTLNLASFTFNIVPKSWGNITVDSRYENYDSLAGLKGKFGEGWNWEAHYGHGRSKWNMVMDQPWLEHLFRAADSVVGPNGTIVCQSAIANPGAYGNCVPINLFGPGSASPEALEYVRGDLLNANVMTQDNFAMSIDGQPFSLWAGPVSFATGIEWRQLEGVATSDPISNSFIDFTGVRGVPSALRAQHGGWQSNNPKPARGESEVKEGFVEVLVPLAREATLAEELDLNAAFRVTDYSQSGTVNTWKVGVTWRPVTDLLFRATTSRDIRAPSISELYAGDATAPLTVVDPFTGGATLNIRSASSGNPDLVPERADTFTVGLTYESSWINGLGLSLDYYDIEIKDVLSSIGAQETVDRCFNGATIFCNQLLRDADGELFLVRLPTLNLDEGRTTGLDLEISYRTDLSWGGRLGMRLIGSRLLERSTSTSTLTGIDYSDRTNDLGQGNPDWRVNLIANYNQGPFGLDLYGRYISSGLLNSTFVVGDMDSRFLNVPSNFTLDLGARYRLEQMAGEPEFYFTAANVFDKDPPLIPGSAIFSPQTNPSLYDTMGRAYSLGVRVNF